MLIILGLYHPPGKKIHTCFQVFALPEINWVIAGQNRPP
jgi:hypothetical protein